MGNLIKCNNHDCGFKVCAGYEQLVCPYCTIPFTTRSKEVKKQIVITLIEDKSGWSGEIYGKVSSKKTKSIKGLFANEILAASCISSGTNLEKIEKWMEQIQ